MTDANDTNLGSTAMSRAWLPGGLSAGDGPRIGGEQDARAMLERLVSRLFLRALQFVVGGVVFGIVFLAARGRGSVVDIATAASLLAFATAALRWRAPLLKRLLGRPALTLLTPLPGLVAVLLDGGFDSVWTPLVAITVGVPATLGLPWLSLVCAMVTASGQAAAAWINRDDMTSARLVETTVFSSVGTAAVGVGIALAVATTAGFLRRRPQVLAELRATDLLLDGQPALDRLPSRHRLPPAPRVPLSSAELEVVARLASGRVPKQIAADLHVTLATVRSHLKHAKHKTHARTLSELVGMFILEDGDL